MPAGANRKQERQYEHIKHGAERRGSSEGRAEEIAARTVNKERAQQGQAKRRSKTSVQDISPERRGGLRSGNRTGPLGRTKAQLYQDARRAGIGGRSKMSKAELEKALSRS
ncbi:MULTISPECIES: plasmid stabilization protein [Saccharopolyspora]|uniref:Plasmid stabilization protein n=1 Tax=Saccharopolyspora gregorii TaxID=33914 RepID=A0ABP6RVK1_9PSEU|nr:MULTISPECIES: plasmid stabilization protein [unclassified Saccharopolyspora]MCA1189080.1 plasmid stabilization protein [Saccharopolyspora sp. 6T]MCA1194357.1 plasmid stabilization protein [Saccharopolyspora sp. 6V]MCA1227274.1 plasmid stabilization protein [Saccharopolyspora sp. 6M]MCA1282211.1 plasmid stabilization protein [Saccharopolyspora sp. 7B]